MLSEVEVLVLSEVVVLVLSEVEEYEVESNFKRNALVALYAFFFDEAFVLCPQQFLKVRAPVDESVELIQIEWYLIIIIMTVVIVFGLYVRLSVNPKANRLHRRTKLKDVYPLNPGNTPQDSSLTSQYSATGRILFTEGPGNIQNFEKYFKGNFKYYDNLSEANKKKFLARVKKFTENKDFSGRNGLKVTEEMKALLAGAAVQLTFGLENFTFDYFAHIIIYPDVYVSPVTGRKHKGEAHPLGAIVISWKDFVKGYSIPDDRYNLGLHEMAHALRLDSHLGNSADKFFTAYYEKWKAVTELEFVRLRHRMDSFLRPYAGTNREEFFAVCVEHFFEAGEEFKRELPEVYDEMCVLLGQDPHGEKR